MQALYLSSSDEVCYQFTYVGTYALASDFLSISNKYWTTVYGC